MTETKKIRVGVIGTGNMGKNHARVFATMRDCELVGVADVKKENTEEIADTYRCEAFTDYHELLKLDLDAVSIVVPTILHKQVAIDCMKAGVHVFCEKPIAPNIEDGKSMIAAAKEYGVHLMVGYIERFNPVITELKKRIVAGELGKIYRIEALRECPFPNRINDVGVVIDLAVHDLDIFSYLLDSDVTKVYATTEQKVHTNQEDMVCALLHFDNGVVGSISTNWLTPVVVRKLKITGEKGMFELDYYEQSLIFYRNPSETAVSVGDSTKIHVRKKEPLLVELEHFVHCVRDNTTPLVGGKDALFSLDIAGQLLASADKGEAIDLQD